jgi:hypothetical protein
MARSIFALIGLLIAFGSTFANAILGSQIALIGIAFILLAIFGELQQFNKKSD